VGVTAAPPRDRAAMAAPGSFRADLYYRLNVLPIRLPALRERMADLEALVEALAEDISRRSGLPHKSLTSDALDLLARHSWPGNIRELRNVLEQATLMTDDLLLTAAHFHGVVEDAAVTADAPRVVEAPQRSAAPTAPVGGASATHIGLIKSLPQAIAELEAHAIRDALAATGGNKQAAAKLLGISRATLYEKLALIDGDHAAL
jgi:DNA-binding NtrC family response regulator